MASHVWTDEQVFFSKDTYFPALIARIGQAQQSIEFETYIFDMDAVGIAVLDALKTVSARGVNVRLLLDGIGSLFSVRKIYQSLKGTSVQIQIYHPFLLTQAFATLNKRLHRKLCIVDRGRALVGSFNVSDRECRDTAAEVSGIEVQTLISGFERRWQKAHRSRRKRASFLSLVRLNETESLRQQWNRDLAERLRSANRRIWITNAYFVPPVFILEALKATATRGVDVRILVTERSDHTLVKWIAETYYLDLLLSGVRIFEFRPCFLHAKTILIDDWAMIGSSNLNHRSLFHDLEVDIVLTHDSSRQALDDQYGIDLSHSKEISIDHVIRLPLHYRFFRWCLLIFRNWV